MKRLAVLTAFGLLLAGGVSSERAAPAKPASPAPSAVPSVRFGTFDIKNLQGIAVTVTVEAPVGTTVLGPKDVAPDGTASFTPNVDNVSSARIIAKYDKDHGTATQTVTLNGEGNALYIKTLSATAGIGSVGVTEVVGASISPSGR